MKATVIALITATFLFTECDSPMTGDPHNSSQAAGPSGDTTPPPPPPPSSGSVATVSVAPDSVSMMAGDTGVRLQVVVRDSAGNLLARNASWFTPDSSFLYLPYHYGEAGVPVFGRASGIGTVYATTDGKSAQAKIVVRDVVPVVAVVPGSATDDRGAGDNFTFRAALTDAAGTSLKYRLVSWSSTDTTVFAVTSVVELNGDSYATIVTRGAGTAALHATCDGKTGEAAITVSVPAPPAPTGSVTVLPDSANLAVGDSAVFTAEVRDPSGNLVSDPPPYWTASDTTVVTLRAAGFRAVVYTHAVGSLTLSATSGGKSGSASIVVR
jgi:hypothetical protein